MRYSQPRAGAVRTDIDLLSQRIGEVFRTRAQRASYFEGQHRNVVRNLAVRSVRINPPESIFLVDEEDREAPDGVHEPGTGRPGCLRQTRERAPSGQLQPVGQVDQGCEGRRHGQAAPS